MGRVPTATESTALGIELVVAAANGHLSGVAEVRISPWWIEVRRSDQELDPARFPFDGSTTSMRSDASHPADPPDVAPRRRDDEPMIAAFSITPLGTGESVSASVADTVGLVTLYDIARLFGIPGDLRKPKLATLIRAVNCCRTRASHRALHAAA